MDVVPGSYINQMLQAKPLPNKERAYWYARSY
jgi:hypothetical protein